MTTTIRTLIRTLGVAALLAAAAMSLHAGHASAARNCPYSGDIGWGPLWYGREFLDGTSVENPRTGVVFYCVNGRFLQQNNGPFRIPCFRISVSNC